MVVRRDLQPIIASDKVPTGTDFTVTITLGEPAYVCRWDRHQARRLLIVYAR